MTEMRPPPAYGYMRVPCDVEDQAIRELELKLKEHADQHGFCLATIFHEFQPGSLMVWDEVATELQRADAHHVIVPSLSHVADHPLLRQNMLDRLAESAEAEVLELADPRLDTVFSRSLLVLRGTEGRPRELPAVTSVCPCVRRPMSATATPSVQWFRSWPDRVHARGIRARTGPGR